nr:MAG TPA: hypothetical protein [Caudoviricetes sp.]
MKPSKQGSHYYNLLHIQSHLHWPIQQRPDLYCFRQRLVENAFYHKNHQEPLKNPLLFYA